MSDAIANRVSDPRVTRFTSITRVEISIDLSIAEVYVSVMGSPTDERTTLQGLDSARGMIQSRLARQLDIRRCPAIRFHLDEQFKQGAQTLQRLDELRETIDKDPDRNAADAPATPNAKNPEERSASHLEDGE